MKKNGHVRTINGVEQFRRLFAWDISDPFSLSKLDAYLTAIT